MKCGLLFLGDLDLGALGKLVHDRRVRQGGRVAERASLGNVTQQSAHDLAAACLWKLSFQRHAAARSCADCCVTLPRDARSATRPPWRTLRSCTSLPSAPRSRSPRKSSPHFIRLEAWRRSFEERRNSGPYGTGARGRGGFGGSIRGT